ncbi:MAG TPA: DUF2207 domain-containing protein [Bacillota bacterium]|nr:DUF2207 domain-containing protein [Bacillota bacterium]
MGPQKNLCPHCGGSGTCQSEDPLCSCPECIDFYQKQLASPSELHLVPCSYCRGTGKTGGPDGFLLCTHCEGGGYCLQYDDHVGCDYCLEKHSLAHPEHIPKHLIQVPCGLCDGKGFVKTPEHMIRESLNSNRPPVGMLRIVIAFVITFIIAMSGSVFVVWAVQADTKKSIAQGNIDEALRFDSYITVHEDRTMTVEEIVILKSKQRRAFAIKRVYPALKVSFFNHLEQGVDLKEVYLDGEPVKFHCELRGKTVIIHDLDRFVAPGIHTYAFIYRMGLPTVKSHGETVLNWVVSGNHWGFPAKQATVAVALPANIRKQSVEAAGGAGPVFWFKRECLSTIDDSGNITFNAGQPLTKLDRFDVRVAW